MIVDLGGQWQELSYDDIGQMTHADLTALVAKSCGISPAQVPSLPFTGMVAHVWYSSSIPGFRYLVSRSPEYATRHGFFVEPASWPIPGVHQIMIISETHGVPEEAIYTLDPQGHLFAPVTARLKTGNPRRFPQSGMVHWGDVVLTPSPSVPSGCNHDPLQLPPEISVAPQLQAISETISKTQRSDKNGTRMLKDEIVDPHFLAVVSADPVRAGNTMFYHVLFTRLVQHKQFIQCPLGVLVLLARGFADHNPNHFVLLDECMDVNSAQAAAKVFIKGDHRHEGKFTGKIVRWWDNRPETLHKTLVSIFQMANALFDYHSVIYAELLLVASRTKMIAVSIPDRPIANNSYFWSEVLDQVNDVLLGAGTQYKSASEVAAALRSVPNFETKEHAKYHLEMIKTDAHKMLWANKASQRVVIDSSPVGASSVGPSESHRGVQGQPGRRHHRDEESDDYQDQDDETVNIPRSASDNVYTSDDSCAAWCSLTGCQNDDCRYAHRLPQDRKAADRLYSIIQRKRRIASPVLVTLWPPQSEQPIDGHGDTGDTSTGLADKSRSTRFRKKLRAH